MNKIYHGTRATWSIPQQRSITEHYVGNYRNCQRHGEGTVTHENGSRYVGEIQEDKYHGKGMLTCANGARYEGDFQVGKFHGKGILTHADGGKYEGDFQVGKFHGEGILTHANGERYKGDFQVGNRHGKGIYTFANGDSYEGDFQEDQCHGEGILTYTNGDRYKGDFQVGKFHGEGILTCANGERYEGDFQVGRFHGKGMLTCANGDSYEGDFLAGKRHGKGMLTCANGDRYEGDFQSGKHHGKGILTRANGDRYETDFQKDTGTLTDIHGKRIVGLFDAHFELLGTPLKVFLYNQVQMKPEHQTYLEKLRFNAAFSDALQTSDQTIVEFFKDQNFNPAQLSPEQVDEFNSYLQGVEWFLGSIGEMKAGIHKFTDRIQQDCNTHRSQALMQEAWRLFGQFVYFMNNDSIKQSNKEAALKEFDGIYFACSESVPERIKGIVSILLNGTPFLNPFVSQRNILIEQYVSSFLDFRREKRFAELEDGYQIHVRPWLANTLAEVFNFHTCHESRTDPYAQETYDDEYLGSYETSAVKNEVLSFFLSKLEMDYTKPDIDDFTAQLTAALYPFRNGEMLTTGDFEKINEGVFDILKPFLEGRVEEFDNRLDLYFEFNAEKGQYSLRPQIFIDIRYLAAKYLELSGYYSQHEE